MYTSKDILVASELKKKSDGELISGLALLKDAQKKPTKNGSFFIDGSVEIKGSMMYKVWSNSSAFTKLDTEEYSGLPVWISGKVNLYGGSTSIVIDDLNAVNISGFDICEDDFFESKYNGQAYFKGLRDTLIKMSGSDKVVKIFDMIMEGNEERFRVEFAAKGHHDNCKSGLVAHTYKVLYIGKVLKLYPHLQAAIGGYDLLYLGAAIHDIGKIVEYRNGTIQGIGQICSHHTFGVEILLNLKDDIVALYDEEFFYRLCSIVEQHHGELEERPRTIEAYVIHLLDKFESDLQYLDQTLDGFEKGNQIVVESFKLC